jgi:hypothetical protein
VTTRRQKDTEPMTYAPVTVEAAPTTRLGGVDTARSRAITVPITVDAKWFK